MLLGFLFEPNYRRHIDFGPDIVSRFNFAVFSSCRITGVKSKTTMLEQSGAWSLRRGSIEFYFEFETFSEHELETVSGGSGYSAFITALNV